MEQESSASLFLTVAHNSFWNLVNYIITGVTSVAITIILTRSLGTEKYGNYSFFMTILAVGSLFLDFGLGQAIAKYIPRYFNDPENKALSVRIFLKSLFCGLNKPYLSSFQIRFFKLFFETCF